VRKIEAMVYYLYENLTRRGDCESHDFAESGAGQSLMRGDARRQLAVAPAPINKWDFNRGEVMLQAPQS
jgi:hypothetical protein